MLSPNY